MDRVEMERFRETARETQKRLWDFFRGPFKKLSIVGGIVILLLMLSPWVLVGPGHRGVVLNFGAVQDVVLDEGLHFRIPVMQKVALIDIRIQKVEDNADAATQDLQDIGSTVALNFHVVPDKVQRLYQQVGPNYRQTIISPAIQETVKAITAKHNADALITQRQKVSDEMRAALTERLAPFLRVTAFSIVNFHFSKAFTEAIEAKQTAVQLAVKAKNDLERVKMEAAQKIEAARAEAEALRLQRMNVTVELIRLRETENQREAIKKWDGRMPQVMAGGGLPLLNLGNFQK